MSESPHYYHRFPIGNQETEFSDLLVFHVLELPKLPKHVSGESLEEWMRFLSVKDREELQMLAEKNKDIKKAARILEELSEDEAARMVAMDEEKFYWDNFYRLEAAEQRGKLEAAVEIAKNLLNSGVAVEVIAASTKLTVEEINRIASESEK